MYLAIKLNFPRNKEVLKLNPKMALFSKATTPSFVPRDTQTLNKDMNLAILASLKRPSPCLHLERHFY